MQDQAYVYILQSESDPRRHYTGITRDLNARLKKHNSGSVPHTCDFSRPGLQSSPESLEAFKSACLELSYEIKEPWNEHIFTAFSGTHLLPDLVLFRISHYSLGCVELPHFMMKSRNS